MTTSGISTLIENYLVDRALVWKATVHDSGIFLTMGWCLL